MEPPLSGPPAVVGANVGVLKFDGAKYTAADVSIAIKGVSIPFTSLAAVPELNSNDGALRAGRVLAGLAEMAHNLTCVDVTGGKPK